MEMCRKSFLHEGGGIQRSRQEYREMQCEVRVEVVEAKQRTYENLDTKEMDLCSLARQRAGDKKDVRQTGASSVGNTEGVLMRKGKENIE